MYPVHYQLAVQKIEGERTRAERERLVRPIDGRAMTVTFGPRWLRTRLGRLFQAATPVTINRITRPAGV